MFSPRRSTLSCKIKTLFEGEITSSDDGTILVEPKTGQRFTFVKIYGVVTIINDKLNKEELNKSFLLDDGTGAIWVSSDENILKNIKLWDFVRVIGEVTVEQQDEEEFDLFLVSDIVKPIDNKSWEIIHNLEVLRSSKIKESTFKTISYESHTSTTFENPNTDNSSKPSTKVVNQSGTTHSEGATSVKNLDNKKEISELTKKIEQLLRSLDVGDGVEFTQIMEKLDSVEESVVDDILFELAYEGKVYQPRPEFYKLMD